MKEKVLIVEDQAIEALNLKRMLGKEGYEVCGIAKSVEKALEIMEQTTPDIVLLDIFLKGSLTGIDLAYQLRDRNIAFVYLSANSNRATLDAAKATNPYGFLVKPVREKDVLVMLEIARYKQKFGLEAALIESVEINSNQQTQPAFLPPKIVTKNSGYHKADHFNSIIGQSDKLVKTLQHLEIVAPTETTVLIHGESGTGKEKIAQYVHDLSQKKQGPFIKVNCAALPSTLIESMLFGHEKGAFTGASERSIGKFEQAQKGTLFLDEIGEIPPEIQVKFLRALQENEIERLGGRETIKLNVRIIAATNRNLEKEIAEGHFRLDLYYRLNVFPLYLPALRERKEDIPLLAAHFIEQFCLKSKRPILKISEDQLKKLTDYSWPGNIRELEHLIERSVLLSTGDYIEIDMPGNSQAEIINTKNEITIKKIDDHERDYILKILKHANGRISGEGGAAELLGIPPSTLNSKIKKLGIKREHY